MSKNSFNLAEYLDKARAAGAVRLPPPNDPFYLVHPVSRVSGAASRFANAGKLLQTPLKRLAYSDRTAWLMATLSELVYMKFESDPQQQQDLIAQLAGAQINILTFFHNKDTDTQGFLAHREGEFRVLVFRGTEDMEDVKTDIKALFKTTPHGKVHQGFLDAYASVAQDVEEELDRTAAAGHDEQLLIAGHSLGGALASVAARMLESRHVVSGCYTFGSPRVGDETFADSFKTPVYRVVNRADPVPMVPGSGVARFILTALTRIPILSWLSSPLTNLLAKGYVGFQHVGDMRFLQGEGEDTRLKIGSAALFARYKSVLFDNLFRPWVLFRLPKIADDHRMAHYVLKLRKIAEDRN